jgi:ABC-type polar amino acid transport system ATPase subunit
MLFDEPTSALDPELIAEVLDAMKNMADEGMTMLVVTHELDFARRVGQRICMFSEGQFIEEGNPEEFFARPKIARTRKFLRQITWEPDSGNS